MAVDPSKPTSAPPSTVVLHPPVELRGLDPVLSHRPHALTTRSGEPGPFHRQRTDPFSPLPGRSRTQRDGSAQAATSASCELGGPPRMRRSRGWPGRPAPALAHQRDPDQTGDVERVGGQPLTEASSAGSRRPADAVDHALLGRRAGQTQPARGRPPCRASRAGQAERDAELVASWASAAPAAGALRGCGADRRPSRAGSAAPMPKVARPPSGDRAARGAGRRHDVQGEPDGHHRIIETTTGALGEPTVQPGPRLAAAIIDTIMGSIHQAASSGVRPWTSCRYRLKNSDCRP